MVGVSLRAADNVPKAEAAGPTGVAIAHGLQRLEAEQLRALLERSERERVLLRALVDQLPDLLFVKDVQSRFLVANRATAIDLGQAAPEDLIGKTDLDFYPPEVGERHFEREQEIIASGQATIDHEELSFDRSAGAKWFSVTKVPYRDDRHEIVGLVGTCHDITERKQASALRAGQAHLLELVARGAPLDLVLDRLVRLIESQVQGIASSILLLDADGLHLRHGAAPSLPKTFSKAIDGALIGPKAGSCGTAAYRREAVTVSDITRDPLWEDYRDLAERHGIRSCWSTPVISHRGVVLGTFAMYAASVHEPTVLERRLVSLATHIAGIAIERKQAEDRIQFMAHHDALTGLPNRTLLLDRLTQAILAARRSDRWVTAVFLDLDNFKLVNDSLGHNAGDDLLKVVARRMTDCLRTSDTVVRLGGDEFVILLADLPKNPDVVTEILQKVRAAISGPIHLGPTAFQITCSMGLATYPSDGVSAEGLLANADAAMYRAKELGRDNFQCYMADMNRKVHERLALQEELRLAIERSEFVLQYQPQIDLRSDRIFAVEALIRWRHPVRGHLSPATFIPIAEDCGLIVPIGRWILREACRQNRAWQDAGLPHVTVSVNVSARQFKEKDFLADVTGALAASRLRAEYLELELTESMVMQDVQQAIAIMRNLAELGVNLSIDDFGTGYSSLSALKSFPVARLKIDQSFVCGLPEDLNDRAIASAVISMAHKLSLKVIAEGVENAEQMAFLRDIGCDEAQGYLIGSPVSAEGVDAILVTGAGAG